MYKHILAVVTKLITSIYLGSSTFSFVVSFVHMATRYMKMCPYFFKEGRHVFL